MTVDLTTATSALLLRLLQVFDPASLGEGDVAAAANVLAGQCISLTNSYPPGACLVSDDGSRLTVGMSFASIGGLMNSLLAEKVFALIAMSRPSFDDTDCGVTVPKMPPVWPNWIALNGSSSTSGSSVFWFSCCYLLYPGGGALTTHFATLGDTAPSELTPHPECTGGRLVRTPARGGAS